MRMKRRLLSGMMAAITIFTTAVSPMMAYASEIEPDPVIPLYAEVKDQLDMDEIVVANDLELSVGCNYDIKTDFTNITIPDESKVKVTFQKAENEAGEDFTTDHEDSYEAVYYVEPQTTNHPTYQISRKLIVKETGENMVVLSNEETVTSDSSDGSSVSSETEEADEDADSDTQEIISTESQTEESSSELTESEEVITESEADTEEAMVDESDLEEIFEQAEAQGIDIAGMKDGETISFEVDFQTDDGIAMFATYQVDVTKVTTYYYSDYGLGSYLTGKYKVSFGGITAIAYCVQPSKPGPGDGGYTVTQMSDGKTLAKVCYYGTKASGEDGFFEEKHPDFSEGKRFIITHIAAAYANGSSDWDSGTNATGRSLAMELYNFCVSQPEIPDVAMEFSDENPAAYLDGNQQRTKSVTFKADKQQTITIKLPSGVRFHNETTGKTSAAGASVEICGGTKFYLSAPLTQATDVKQTFSQTMRGSITKDYSAFKISTGGSVQDLALVFGEGVDDEQYIDFSVKWLEIAYVAVEKKDSETANGIAGAVYGLYKDAACTNLITKLPATDMNGKSNVMIVKEQETVYLKEISVPTGYLIDTLAHNVKLVASKTTTVNVTEKEVKGEISVRKIDVELERYEGQGDATLKGAVYGLYAAENIVHPDGHTGVIYKKDEMIEEMTFGDIETITFKNLHLGKYYVMENQEPVGYLKDDTKYAVTLSYKDDKTAVIKANTTVKEQVMKQAFQIIKVSTNGTADEIPVVAKAEFTVKLASEVAVKGWNEATVYDVLTTDDTGYAKSIELPYGTYIVKETKTPVDMMTIPDFKVEITKDSREPQNWRVFNDAPFEAYIRMIKKDVKTGQIVLLSGISFKIKDVKTGEFIVQKIGNKKIDTFVTEENGMVTTPLKLAVGEYEVTEIEAPNGYTIKTESVPFTVTSSGIIQVTEDEDGDPVIDIVIENEEVTGKVNLYKHGEYLKESKLTDIIQDVVTGIVDAVLNLDGDDAADEGIFSEQKNVSFVYEDMPIEKACFHLVADEDIYTPDWQRDEDGNRVIASFDGKSLTKGTVVACLETDKEGKASVDGLPLGKYHLEEVQTVDGFTINKEVDAFELAYVDQNTAEITYDSDFVNERVKVMISLLKKDSKTEKPVEGATYALYAAEDITNKAGEVVVAKDGFVERGVTDNNGVITFEADLPLGTYYVQETVAAPGYLLNETRYDLDCSYRGADVEMVAASVETTDEPITVEIKKTDITSGEEISGAHLQVLTKDGEIYEEWDSTEEAHVIYGIPAGDYILRETLAPTDQGYVKATDVEFTVKETGEVQSVEMKDDFTKLEIKKTDITTGDEVVGAHLQILTKDGTVYEEWDSTEEAHIIEYIPVGDYILRETLAPTDKGYVKATDIEFTVEETSEVQSVEMKDDFTKVEISKTDITGEKELPGAKLTILDKDGKVVETWTSEEKAHYIERLPVGKYTLREESAPKGYLVAEDIEFEVKETAEIQKVVMKDKAEETPDKPTTPTTPNTPTDGPKTGDDSNMSLWMMISGIAALIGVALIGSTVVRRKRK